MRTAKEIAWLTSPALAGDLVQTEPGQYKIQRGDSAIIINDLWKSSDSHEIIGYELYTVKDDEVEEELGAFYSEKDFAAYIDSI